MAVSSIIPRKTMRNRTRLQSMSDRHDYDQKAEKTNGGELVSSYMCTPETAAEEFEISKQLYYQLTGRSQSKGRDVLMYRIIQSFRPGEVSPEEANRIGYELAMKFTGGQHQFVVATHVDKAHIHTHIEINSTNLNCDGKFRDVKQSALLLRQLNDELCRAHGLSVIENPKPSAKKQKEMAAAKYGTSFKEQLRQTIDCVLPECRDYDDFLAKMRAEGYEIKEEKNLSFRAPGQERFTRSNRLGADYTREALRERCANRHGRSAAVKTPTLRNGRKVNMMIVPLKNMINEAYAADISRKVKAQQRQAMRDGQFVGAQPPYGYKKDPDDCHHLLVNEETAPAIQQIFQWTADGVPLGAVVKRLNEQGTPSPDRYLAQIGLLNKQSQKAQGMWQTWTVAKILDSEVYMGDMIQGRSKMIGHKQVPTPPEEWIIVRNTHEPLVSRELFEKAKSVRKQATAKTAGEVNRGTYTENILRGRIFCGACGRHMNRHRDNKLGVYSFSCIANQRIKKDVCPRTAYIREDTLFHIILTIIQQEAENVVGKNLQLKQHSGKIAMQREATEKEISQLRQETEKNRKFLTGLLESFNTGILTRAEYLEMKENYSQEINAALQRVQQLQIQQKELESQMERYCCLADRLAAVEYDTALSSLLVDQLIERVTVNSSSDVTIKFLFESSFEQVMEVLKDE